MHSRQMDRQTVELSLHLDLGNHTRSARAHFIAPKFSPTEAVRSFPGRLEEGTFQYRQRCRDSALDVAGPGLQTFFAAPSQAARKAEHRTRILGISVSNGIFNQCLAGDTSCGHAARLGALTLMSSHFPQGPTASPRNTCS